MLYMPKSISVWIGPNKFTFVSFRMHEAYCLNMCLLSLRTAKINISCIFQQLCLEAADSVSEVWQCKSYINTVNLPEQWQISPNYMALISSNLLLIQFLSLTFLTSRMSYVTRLNQQTDGEKCQ